MSDISLLRASAWGLRNRDAQVVPYRHSHVRLHGPVVVGGRLEIGRRWPERRLEPPS
jgi:hypothetical protein